MRGIGAGGCRQSVRVGACLVTVTFTSAGLHADTLPGALVLAYQNNPQLNAQRAAVRVTDEQVPIALSGYRPRVSLSASVYNRYSWALNMPAKSNSRSFSCCSLVGGNGLRISVQGG